MLFQYANVNLVLTFAKKRMLLKMKGSKASQMANHFAAEFERKIMKKFFKPILLITALFLLSVPVYAAGLVSPIQSQASIAEGYYVLMPQCASGKVLSVKGASVSRYATFVSKTYDRDGSQIFYISRNTDGTYTIKNKKSKMVLGIKGASTADGAIVRQAPDSKSSYQKWYIFKWKSYYMIQSAISRKMLTVKGSSSLDNTKVYMHTYHQHMKGEHWTFIKVGGSVSSSTEQEEDEITPKYPTSSKTGMSSQDYEVLNNIIGAVETGGQVYGQRDYSDYTAPYANTSLEVTCTLGWGAFYGEEAQYLVQKILDTAPKTFKKIDKKGLIQEALKQNWVKTKWKPTAEEQELLVALISTSAGKKIQDAMVTSLMKTYVSSCKSQYTSNTWAIMMYCEIRHLGGKGGADRIFQRCESKGSYSLDTIMWALKQDQKDKSSSYQVGDSVFWQRHEKCCEFIVKYA